MCLLLQGNPILSPGGEFGKEYLAGGERPHRAAAKASGSGSRPYQQHMRLPWPAFEAAHRQDSVGRP